MSTDERFRAELTDDELLAAVDAELEGLTPQEQRRARAVTEERFRAGDPCPYCGEPMTRLVRLSDGWVHADCLPTPPVAPAANETAIRGR